MASLEADSKPFVTQEEGDALAADVGALCYVECSARRIENVRLAFEQALHYLISHQSGGRSNKCCDVM